MSNRILIRAALLVAAMQLASLPAKAADPIVVGRSLPLSGPLQSYGEAKRDGGDAYIQKLNASGGIRGRAVELVTVDDAYTPSRTIANLNRIAAERAPTAFLGLFGVPTVSAALPVLAQLRIPAVGLTSGANELRSPLNRYAFPVRASYADEARRLVNHVKTIGITKISVIYTENPFGQSVKDTLLMAFEQEGLKAEAVKVDPAAAGAEAAARLAIAGEPQAVFLTMLSQAAVPTLTAVRKTGFRGSLYAFSPIDTSTITKELGASAQGLAITQVVPIPLGTRVSVVSEYIQALKELGRGTPSFYGLEAFIEAKVLVEGLRRAAPQPTAAALVKSLETLHELDVGGYYVSYTPERHTGSLFVEIDVINAFGQVKR